MLRKKSCLLITALLFMFVCLASELTENELIRLEEEGIDLLERESVKNTGERSLRDIPPGGLLLIPESTNDRVMAFDPITGDLVDENFIPTDATNLATPIEAMLTYDGTGILVSDQIRDVVQLFDLDGNFVRTFAPIGGPDTSILDNVRGIEYHTNNNLLVSLSGGANADAVAEFDTEGNWLGNFIANGETDPFDVLYWESPNEYLIADIATPDIIKRYDSGGNYIANLTDYVNFPEQIAFAANGNILVACFSTPSGVHEYLPNGTLVGVYDVLTSLRGVYELPNGNILTTNGTGVYEINRSNVLVDTKYSGVSARFINFVPGEGTLPAPENLSITVTPQNELTEVYLEWDAVEGASSYTVYRNSDPYALFPDDWTAVTGITTTFWTYITDRNIRFYRVTANN